MTSNECNDDIDRNRRIWQTVNKTMKNKTNINKRLRQEVYVTMTSKKYRNRWIWQTVSKTMKSKRDRNIIITSQRWQKS